MTALPRCASRTALPLIVGLVVLTCAAAVSAQPSAGRQTADLVVTNGYVVTMNGAKDIVENGAVVGTCGFAAPPVDGVVEIAYFSFPGNEGRGLATRMAAELLALSQPLAQQNQYQVIAHTMPEEGPSPVILRKLGFEWQGEIVHPEDGPVWKWRLGRV